MTKTYDRQGNVTSRTILTDKTANAQTRITQVPTSDGGWWNISVERIGR